MRGAASRDHGATDDHIRASSAAPLTLKDARWRPKSLTFNAASTASTITRQRSGYRCDVTAAATDVAFGGLCTPRA